MRRTYAPFALALLLLPVARLAAVDPGGPGPESLRGAALGDPASAEPGAILFDVVPAGARCSSPKLPEMAAEGRFDAIAPGRYRAILRKAGYKTAEIEFEVRSRETTVVSGALQALRPGSVVLPASWAEVEVLADGARIRGRPAADGQLWYDGLPTEAAVQLRFEVPGARSTVPPRQVNLPRGGSARLELPVGRFALPWLAPGSAVSILGKALPYDGASSFESPPLPAGTYAVSVAGRYPFEGEVEVAAGGLSEPAGYRAAVVGALGAERSGDRRALSLRRARTGGGIFSLGLGLAGAAGAAWAYVRGSSAGDAYDAAEDSASLSAAHREVVRCGYLFPAAAAVGGIGLALSPFLLFGGPDGRELEESVAALDEEIEALRRPARAAP